MKGCFTFGKLRQEARQLLLFLLLLLLLLLLSLKRDVDELLLR